MGDHRGDELAGEGGRVRVAFLLGEVAFEDGIGGPLAEVRLEHRREGEPTTGPPTADPVSPRRHRPGP